MRRRWAALVAGVTGARRPSPATAGVLVVLVAAGLLFQTSAHTARGTQLRTDRTDLVGLLRNEQARLDVRRERVRSLREEVDAATAEEAAVNTSVAGLRREIDTLAAVGGLAPVAGPGLVVTLNDAPHGGTQPDSATPDDLVVHQQDVQAVVNALWAGGAEAMMLMDQRVISTSAVRCVGNTLILQGRVYSPPYRIAAIGSSRGMRDKIAASPDISIYLEYVHQYGLGWSVLEQQRLAMPAFTGSLDMRFAQIPQPSASASARPRQAGSGAAAPSASVSGSPSPSVAGRQRPPG